MPQDPQQDQYIEGSSIEDSSVQLGQAGGDVTQIQGSNNWVFKFVVNLFGNPDFSPRQAYRNRQILLKKVRNSWVKGVLENSLYKRVQLELGLEERWDALDLDYATPEQPRQPLPKGTKALDKFDELGAGCTLLILGEPGAGKTTALLELARDLIARAEQDVDLPIPVVFNLSSWSAFKGIARKPPTLKDWLIDELNTKYQVSKFLAKTWLTQQDLLLLLDGLDEVRANKRDACVQAINDFHQEHGLTEIVVCSRIQDYENLTNRLRFQGAIFIQPLTTEQVEAYLNDAGNDLAGLKMAWKADSVLQELAKTPLMLSVIAFIYRGMTDEVPTKSLHKALQDHFWETYVNKMIGRRENSSYSSRKTKKWLSFLAIALIKVSETLFQIEQLQPTYLKKESAILSYGLYTNLLVTLWFTFGGLWAITLKEFNSLSEATIIPLFTGIGIFISNLFMGFAKMINWKLKRRDGEEILSDIQIQTNRSFSFDQIIIYSKTNILRDIFILFLVFVVILIPASILSMSHWNAPFLLILTRYVTIFSPLAFISLLFHLFAKGFKDSIKLDSDFPNESIWRILAQVLLVMIPFIIMQSIICLFMSKESVLTLVLLIFLGFSGSSLCLMLANPLFQHIALRITCFQFGDSPWNYARFLDWCSDKLLLQKVGGGYIFIHRSLMEHFAQMEEDS